MPFFSRRTEPQEPSYSRVWIARNGPGARKLHLAIAVIASLVDTKVGDSAAWGQSADEHGLAISHAAFRETMHQDRSLARHVARDLVLFFEANGGLFINEMRHSKPSG